MKRTSIRAFSAILVASFCAAAGANDAPPSLSGAHFVSGGGLLLFRELGDGGVQTEGLWPWDVFEWCPTHADDGTVTLDFDMTQFHGFGATSGWRLAPSATVPGDWDLVEFRPYSYSNVIFAKSDGGFSCESYEPPYSKVDPPIPGWLHRVPEQPWRAYFDFLDQHSDYQGRLCLDPERARALARAVLDSAPDDPAAQAVWMDALVFARDDAGLEEAIAAWGDGFVAHGNPHYRRYLHRAGREIEAVRLDRAGLNASSLVEYLHDRRTGSAERLQCLPDILGFDCWRPASRGVFVSDTPNFIDWQVSNKVVHVEAAFGMMRGEREKALRMALASYREGQLFDQDDKLISLLIGVALRQMASQTLELWLLNACETPEELAAFRDGTEALRDLAQDWSADEIALRTGDSEGLFPRWENFGAAEVRNRVANQRFELLRSAAAARKYRMAGAAWPESARTANVLFAKDAPRDLFSGEWLLGGRRGDGFVVYSVGPDKADDVAAVAYDPTNGTVSGGDIFVEIPAERRYPFSRAGFKPATMADVGTAFPNGLPADPFADTRFRPLNAKEATEGVAVFSFGPDADQRYHTPEGEYAPMPMGDPFASPSPAEIADRRIAPPQPQYDPTNGTVSRGNLNYRP